MSSTLFRTALAIVAAAALTVGCAPSVPVETATPTAVASKTPTPTPTIVPDTFAIVVLGDSLATPKAVDCAGCDSFVDQIATTLKGQLGEKIEVIDHTEKAADLTSVSLGIGRSDQLKDDLEHAEIVIVSVGFQEGPPWEGEACPGAPSSNPQQNLAVISSYTAACVTETITIFGERYSDLFDTITTLSPDARSRFALTTYNSFLGNPTYGTLDVSVTNRLISIFNEFNKAQCDSAVTVGFECIDVYHAINGTTGRDAGGALLSRDYTHFSQAGHDAIASLITRSL